MYNLRIGDIVTRKSYGGDIFFKVTDVRKNESGKTVCTLKGLLYRIEADSSLEDLEVHNYRNVMMNIYREMDSIVKSTNSRGYSGIPLPVFWLRGRAGRVLQIDSSRDFLQRCLDYYRNAGIKAYGYVAAESEQPTVVKKLLEQYNTDILVLTGHDSMKKNASKSSLESYTNSKYYIESVKIARKYQSNKDKLCIFAGACQSNYEAIIAQGANFASSPGRILIHALDPAIVSEDVALTDSRKILIPSQVAALTKSGAQGIGGIETRGHYFK